MTFNEYLEFLLRVMVCAMCGYSISKMQLNNVSKADVYILIILTLLYIFLFNVKGGLLL